MRAYYLISNRIVFHPHMAIADEHDQMLYLLTTDAMKHSWSLKTFDQGHTLFVFEHGFTQSSIKFTYKDHHYIVKKSAWNAHVIVSSDTDLTHRYKYLNAMYKDYFYIDGIEKSYYDEDSSIIATHEEDTLFLLLIHLAVYIIMHR